MPKQKSILAEVAELESMELDELRSRWVAVFEMQPPITATRQYLIGRLAYRLQEIRFGGIPEKTLETLQRLVPSRDRLGTRPQPDTPMPDTGEILLKTWRGTEYAVRVLKHGYEYQGVRYRSLSAVAREITGTQWNGRAFFGIGKERKSS